MTDGIGADRSPEQSDRLDGLARVAVGCFEDDPPAQGVTDKMDWLVLCPQPLREQPSGSFRAGLRVRPGRRRIPHSGDDNRRFSVSGRTLLVQYFLEGGGLVRAAHLRDVEPSLTEEAVDVDDEFAGWNLTGDGGRLAGEVDTTAEFGWPVCQFGLKTVESAREAVSTRPRRGP